jgi:elongator complex protein 3
MPGLPNSNPEKDFEMFKQIFSKSSFMPDMIKIYPCLVLKDTKTYEWYLKGSYRPYSTEDAANLIVEVKKIIPPWVRIMRVQRDIPAPLIVSGVTKSNLRQLVQQKLRQQGIRCRCIRCREVGHRIASDNVEPNPEQIAVQTARYKASEGEEVFLSAEDAENDVLIGYLRLRIPSEKARRPEIRNKPCAIIRELHVYGPLVPVGKHSAEAWQHKGYGEILLDRAEQMTHDEYGFKKILIISALGTKQYYRRFGYKHDGVYMSKLLRN